MSIQIIEILGRATQGVTRPFICIGQDREFYFVKGRGAGRRSLICEWIAGALACKMGLPVAPFQLVDVPQELIALETRDDLNELGAGVAFGSRKQDVVELSLPHLPEIPDPIKQDVIIFDWWVQNADRSLSDAGGNPNLFWDENSNQLVVIDHNQAFDPEFSVSEFCCSHVFRQQIRVLSKDQSLQQHYAKVFDKIMSDWLAICNSTPEEWWFIDDEQTLPVDFDRNKIKTQLLRYRENAFWKMI